MSRRLRVFGSLYLLLLSASWLVQALDRSLPALPADRAAVTVTPTQPGEVALAPARISYVAAGPVDAAGDPIVILHGSPSSGALTQMIPGLSGNQRVLAVDLPGFGPARQPLPDYSIVAHAAYLKALLDELGIERAHLVGYSMGGGVALALYDQAPERVRSVTLVSSIGVQELELFGDYHLNHAVHGAQLAAVTALDWLLPHFGALDAFVLNRAYACNFYDTDQRPLRGILERFRPPMLILHGRDDALVSPAAALEHHRLVPHSKLQMFTGGHGMVFSRAAELTGPTLEFIQRVESGMAATRDQATAERRAAASAAFDWRQAGHDGAVATLVILLLLALATFVSEDLSCIAAGLLVARGTLAFVPATLACMVGIFVGDLLLFVLGRYAGRPALASRGLRWLVSREQVAAASDWFDRRGARVILASRFLPGTRTATYVAAGALGLRLRAFVGWFALAVVLWTPLLVGVAALAGEMVWTYVERLQAFGTLALLASILALFVLVRLLISLATWRGRRLLLGRWRRLTRWEFWPMWFFYPPVVLYILWLGLRHRSPAAFTAANPAMPAAGLIGESKSAILAGFGDADDVIAHWRLLSGNVDERIVSAREFMADEQLSFPVVLKPDVGERGNAVCIVRNDQALRDYLHRHAAATLIQAFAPGHEYGVFYLRYPDRDTGEIFAVTDKIPPAVTGDGHRTLERLILEDDRAVCMAPMFLGRFAGRLQEVPAAGERLELVEVGTHCLGCEFRDGGEVVTPDLLQAIDKVSKRIPGFYFGRYDIRTPDVAAFREGREFRIVELNGVSSEATNIYEPGNSLWSAYATLFAQWRAAFAIGAANQARGAPVTPPLQLLRLWLAHR